MTHWTAFRFLSAKATLAGLGLALLTGCFFDETKTKEEEEISLSEAGAEPGTVPDSLNSVPGNAAFGQVASRPHRVVLTGLPGHRLVTVYKTKPEKKDGEGVVEQVRSYARTDYDGEQEGGQEHFMPGLDILYGHNLLNIAHYDLQAEKLDFWFKRPVLVRNVYYPSYAPDSLDRKPVVRDYFLVSAYDQDTNQDSLINRRDLRRFYHLRVAQLAAQPAAQPTALVPANYSVLRSQYDPANDAMYVFAQLDANQNGTAERAEPIHVFWISLKAPAPAKRLY
jgi:hypothetical protein